MKYSNYISFEDLQKIQGTNFTYGFFNVLENGMLFLTVELENDAERDFFVLTTGIMVYDIYHLYDFSSFSNLKT